ncbi:DASH complex subunit ask1 [Linnemannia gamsii]|uniref:DASH complex subunit ASK1 n=1 Tax=Linnemannia gamsii TaxID=64522 RepID=A0A9P6R881_9FUNG|nr:DASH complex subunit ask1 [Linnemannia gamsii]
MASSSTSSSSNPLTTDDVLDEIERLDQNITRTMQEIDQSFSDCQIIVSSKILPQIDRFAESSREVWEHARLWINFFEAATAPSTPAVGRRAQAIRNAKNRQQAAMAASTGASNTQGKTTAALSESTTPDYNQSDDLSSSTNRRRISSINLASSRLSPDFLDGSPLGSLPPTPTPLGSSRNRLRQGAHIAPPAKIQWPSKDGQGNATPTRQPYDYQGELDRGSTTPTITLRDRPMSLSSYTQKANATTAATTTPTRGNVSGGFQELDVHEDHQDVITPPTTLQFSVPESKMATTPRSVLAKSRVNKIQMKDGLVIPQPIFVNDDEDVEDPAFVARYTGRGSDEADIGGSKKRGREGDFLDQEDDPAHGRSWASLTEQQRNKERLLKSPRKMASVQDFFAVPSSTARSQNQEQGDDSEERPQNPSPVTTTVTTTSAPMSSAPTVTFSSMPPPSSSSAVSVSTVTAAVSTSASRAATISTPVSTSGAMNPPARVSNDNSIDSLFRQSLSSGFEATSNRRQTIATPTDLSRGPYGHPGAFSSRGGSGRNSIGGSTFRSALTSAPFSTPNPAGSVNGRLSLLGSALRKPLYPTSPSPASRAAASAIAAAAAASNSSKATSSAQQHSPPPPSPRRTNGLARPSMPAGMAAYSAGGSARMASTPANMLSQKQSAGTTPSFTPGQSNTHLNHTGDYSGAFSTPFSRNPPPAPRLGYHSDTLMTQSSLGLNHDGFGGYDSEDRTRMTMASASSSGLGGGGGGRVGDGMSSAGGHTSATSDSGPFTEEEEDETGDGDDDDVTGSIMRSPCPPGRTFYGSTTDLKSVAQATASNPSLASKAASSSLASQQQHRRF